MYIYCTLPERNSTVSIPSEIKSHELMFSFILNIFCEHFSVLEGDENSKKGHQEGDIELVCYDISDLL